MTRDRASGIALILGALAGLVTMALHPTGHDLMDAVGRSRWPARINLIAHSIAIASSPVLLFGAMGLNRRISAGHGLATLALVTYGFALTVVVVAAIASGLLAPDLIEWVAGSEGTGRQLVEVVLHYNAHLNQAFAKVFVMLSSVAIVIWSVAILRTHDLPRWIGILGTGCGAIVSAALVLGVLTLDVHGFTLIMVVQSTWLIAVGTRLYQQPRSEGADERGNDAPKAIGWEPVQ